MSDELFAALRQAVIDGDAAAAATLAQQVLDDGVPPLAAIDDGLVPGLSYVGEQFGLGELFLPDMMLAARAMQKAMAILEPELQAQAAQRHVVGRVVIGTVKGDIHEIGKNLVGMMLSTSGFEVHDLGVDVAPDRFVEAAKEHNADIIGVSALLTTTMAGQRTVVEALAAAGLRPTGQGDRRRGARQRELGPEIGADGYSEDAIGAVALARRLMGVEAARDRLTRHDPRPASPIAAPVPAPRQPTSRRHAVSPGRTAARLEAAHEHRARDTVDGRNRPRLEVLSPAAIGRIHAATLDVIERVGVRFPSARAQAIWAEHGATVDRETGVVRAPAALIEEALRAAPAAYTLGARDPAPGPAARRRARLPRAPTAAASRSWIRGPSRSAAPRSRTSRDIARVADALPEIAFHWVAVSAQDVAPETRSLDEITAVWRNSTKHVQTESIVTPGEAEVAIEMATAVAGGREAMRARPALSLMQCTISPLAHDGGAIDAGARWPPAAGRPGRVT